MRPARKFKGFTLVELMVSVAVLAILLAIGIPAFQSTLDKRRLTGAAEQLYADLQFARSEAIRQNKRVTVYFNASTWCYGMDVEPSSDCDCSSAPGNCTVGGVQKVVSGTDFRNVALSNNFASNNVTFDPRRGTA
ncbi:MAG: GspH/FimT family pseudopilin, partial [Gammaproteobacteria bacterium]